MGKILDYSCIWRADCKSALAGDYIHQNPVHDMIVDKPEEYLFSSARNYAELPSLLDIILETPQLKTYG